MEKERMTLNILTCNRIMEFYGLLVSLRKQTFQDWDLVVVDSSTPPCSGHKTIQDMLVRLKCEGHRVKYIIPETAYRGNIGVLRNIAIENSETELLVRIDDDSVCEPDYLERLYRIATRGILLDKDGMATVPEKELNPGMYEDGYRYIPPTSIGGVGGIVPTFGSVEYQRKTPTIFNETIFDTQGNIVQFGDDGGFSYEPKAIVLSHHLRSSFLFRKSAAQKAGLHPSEAGPTGFREESCFCFRIQYAGFVLITDTAAICWHLRAPSGGARVENYEQRIAINDAHFRRKWKRWFLQKGAPWGGLEKYGL